eukprot:scaffold18264_cov50-Skeletonema_dohrnii-CCMP3373.AAC.1
MAEDYATYFLSNVFNCSGYEAAAAHGACLNIRDGPEVESEDEWEGIDTAEINVQTSSRATPSVTVTKKDKSSSRKAAKKAKKKEAKKEAKKKAAQKGDDALLEMKSK